MNGPAIVYADNVRPVPEPHREIADAAVAVLLSGEIRTLEDQGLPPRQDNRQPPKW